MANRIIPYDYDAEEYTHDEDYDYDDLGSVDDKYDYPEDYNPDFSF